MKVGSCMEGVNPKCRWEGSMGMKSEHEFVDTANHAFSFPILLGGVWAREADIEAGG